MTDYLKLKKFLKMTKENFIETPENFPAWNHMRNALRKKTNEWFILCGEPGTGKTFTAVAILNHLKNNCPASKPVVDYNTALELLIEIKSDYQNSAEIIKYYSTLDFLVIDEIEKLWRGQTPENDINILFTMLNRRYYAEKPTILIANGSAEKIQKLFLESMLDRFSECATVYEFKGKSLRVKNVEGDKK